MGLLCAIRTAHPGNPLSFVGCVFAMLCDPVLRILIAGGRRLQDRVARQRRIVRFSSLNCSIFCS